MSNIAEPTSIIEKVASLEEEIRFTEKRLTSLGKRITQLEKEKRHVEDVIQSYERKNTLQCIADQIRAIREEVCELRETCLAYVENQELHKATEITFILDHKYKTLYDYNSRYRQHQSGTYLTALKEKGTSIEKRINELRELCSILESRLQWLRAEQAMAIELYAQKVIE